MNEVRIRATKVQIEELKSSIIWGDILRELNMWKRGFRLEMESIVDDASDRNPSTASVLLHMGDINGRVKAVDYVVGILDVFISILESEKEEKDE